MDDPNQSLSAYQYLEFNEITDLTTSFHTSGTQVSSGLSPARWTPVNPVRSGRKQRQRVDTRCGFVWPGRRTTT